MSNPKTIKEGDILGCIMCGHTRTVTKELILEVCKHNFQRTDASVLLLSDLTRFKCSECGNKKIQYVSDAINVSDEKMQFCDSISVGELIISKKDTDNKTTSELDPDELKQLTPEGNETRECLPETIVIIHEGNSYLWNGKKWCDKNTYLEPPRAIMTRLDALAADQITAQDNAVTDLDELLKKAKQAQEHDQIQRSLNLIRRVHNKRPTHIGTVAMMCSILRTANQPEKALALADSFRSSKNSSLLTSRAAALCDLNRWDEGLKQIRQVLAIVGNRGGSAEMAFAVYHRIKQAAPELFDD